MYVCVYSGGGAELTRERDGGRKKETQSHKEQIKVKERHAACYSEGGRMVILGLQK